MARRPEQARGRRGAEAEGLVCAISVRHAKVLVGDRLLRCRYGFDVRDREGPFTRTVAAGDRVRIETPPRSEPLIASVLPRTNYLSRLHGPTRREQIIVANPDRILIVSAAAEPSFRPRLVDRVLVASERAGAHAVVVVNKVDLAGDRAEVDDWAGLYRALGYAVFLTSVATGEGIPELRESLSGGITVACGQSGVGKSSLLAALDSRLELRTQPISERWGKGQHTTTRVELFPFVGGGFLADTPGVKSFGIAGLEASDVAVFFREFQPFIESCRFHSCTHTHEPDCAVARAAVEGRIDPRRFESYLRIVTGEEPEAGDDSPADEDVGEDAGDDGSES